MVKSNLLLIFLLQGKKFTRQPGVISVHILLRLSGDGVGPALPSDLLGSLCMFHSICHVIGGALHHLQSCWTLCTVHSICQVTGRELRQLQSCWTLCMFHSIFQVTGHVLKGSPVLLGTLWMFHSICQVTGQGQHHLQSCWALCVHFTPSVRWRGGDCTIFSPVGHSVYVSLHLSVLLDSLCTFHSTFQVTGRVLKGGDVAGLEDIMALPVLTSSARCPEFNFRMTINSGRQKANPEMLLLLRVYTVDIITEQVAVIGSCLVKVFDNSKKKVCLLGSTWGYFGGGGGGGYSLYGDVVHKFWGDKLVAYVTIVNSPATLGNHTPPSRADLVCGVFLCPNSGVAASACHF